MKTAIVALPLIVALAAAQGTQTFTGTISDELCAKADHSQMQMGANDAECTTACVSAHGAGFVLFDGKDVYKLSGGQKPDAFAGQKVKVTGTLDAKAHTIRVEAIARTK